MNNLQIDNIISFKTVELKKGEKYEVKGKEIITVVSGKIFQILTENILKTFESSLFFNGNEFEALENSLLTVVGIDNSINHNNVDVENDFGEFCRKNWTSVYDEYGVLKGTDLYKSEVFNYKFNGKKYKSNYWFCGKNVDCGIHYEHNFIEIHTSILGDGRMEKFVNDKEETILEQVNMRPGLSHRPFNKIEKRNEEGSPIYPFHRWKGNEKGDIWLVIEEYENNKKD